MTPRGLDEWWTKSSAGEPRSGAVYDLRFGPGFDWARVSEVEPNETVEFQMIEANSHWGHARAVRSRGRQRHHASALSPSGVAGEQRVVPRLPLLLCAAHLRVLRRNLEHVP
jgi:hypothetical protein